MMWILLSATTSTRKPQGTPAQAIQATTRALLMLISLSPLTAEDRQPDTMMNGNATEPIHYQKHIRPLLERHCIECHGPKKSKAGLRLDSLAAVYAGSKFGSVVTPGSPENSTLYTLCTLPPDDDDRMPSKGAPLSTTELDLLKQWIAAGADSADLSTNPNVDHDPLAPLAADLPAIEHTIVAKLISHGAIVDRLSENGRLIAVTCHHSDSQKLSQCLQLLTAIGPNIYRLNVSRSAITNADVRLLTDLSTLTELDCSQTNLGNDAITAIASAPQLQWLNLAQTRVDDHALTTMEQMHNLTQVYLWNSPVSLRAVKSLRRALPTCTVNTGE